MAWTDDIVGTLKAPDDQRLRSLVQNFVLHAQPIKLPTKPPHLGTKLSVHGYQLTVINSSAHDHEH